MKKTLGLSVIILLFCFTLSSFFKTPIVNSIPPKSVSDSMSTSQYSYFGFLGTGNSTADTEVRLDMTQGPSRTSNNLFIGDTLSIGVSGTMHTYTVEDIGLTNAFFINPGLIAADIAPSAVVIASRSATHTVSFQPQVNSAGGHWQFLLKATSTAGEKYNDGIPDQNGFDLAPLFTGTAGTTIVTAAVTCPWGATATIGTTMMLAVGSTSAVTQAYNVVDCALAAGVGNPAGTGASGTIVIGTGASGFINPTPSHLGALEGTSNIFTYVLRHTDASNNLIDMAVGRLAVVESVRITATVDPTISFYIDNVGVTNAGASVCGSNASVGALYTTGDSVTFGSLALTAFNQLAQRMSCVTNSSGGYVVTAYESSQMHNVNTGATIADTNCDGACGVGSSAVWTTDNTHSEFGYSLENVTGTQAAFTGVYSAFGTGPTAAKTIMARASTPPATDQIRVCYRVTASTTQEAGDYEAKVVYTATATF